MIVGSAPLRVSLLGGGSDVPTFFGDNLGAVLGGSINFRVYVCVTNMIQSAEYPFRFTYRQVDNAQSKSEIQHPVWRKLLESRQEISRLNAATFSDVPGNSGLGSSSSFTVASIAALKSYLGQEINLMSLYKEAIRVERIELAEAGGWQDHLHATYGGFRLYTFQGNDVLVGEELLSEDDRESLNSSSVLIKVGGGRNSSGFHSSGDVLMSGKTMNDLQAQAQLAIQGAQSLRGDSSWPKKFELLCQYMLENWKIKKSIQAKNSSEIDELISFGLRNGAESAKLCGAGGSGYVLFLGHADGIKNLRSKVDSKLVLDFSFESHGVSSINV